MWRCHNPNCPSYADYGGRGIFVDEAWHEFDVFVRDIERTIGKRPGADLTLDRIDNDRGYGIGNVRWADRRTQRINSRPRRQIKDLLAEIESLKAQLADQAKVKS